MARRFTVFVRDTRVLLREFRWQLFFGAAVLLGGGAAIANFYDVPGVRHPGFVEAVYDMMQMMALQSALPFPHALGLRLLFFLTPIVSLLVLAESLVRFGVLFFNRRNRMEAWNVSIAATEKDHVVICGLGRIGYRIALELSSLGESCVAIESRKDSQFLDAIRATGIAVLIGDARSREQLEAAGVPKAKAVICASNDDLANVEIALTARQIRPGIRVIVRMFDAGLAEKFGAAFDMETFSTTAISAPVFAAAALDRHILHSFHLGGRSLSLGRIAVGSASGFRGQPVRDVEAKFDASIVALVRNGEVDLHPAPDVKIAVGDELTVLASLDVLRAVTAANGPDPDETATSPRDRSAGRSG